MEVRLLLGCVNRPAAAEAPAAPLTRCWGSLRLRFLTSLHPSCPNRRASSTWSATSWTRGTASCWATSRGAPPNERASLGAGCSRRLWPRLRPRRWPQ